MIEIKVIDCGRTAMQEVIATQLNDGYELLSTSFIEQHKDSAGFIHTMFALVFKRGK